MQLPDSLMLKRILMSFHTLLDFLIEENAQNKQ